MTRMESCPYPVATWHERHALCWQASSASRLPQSEAGDSFSQQVQCIRQAQIHREVRSKATDGLVFPIAYWTEKPIAPRTSVAGTEHTGSQFQVVFPLCAE